MLEPRQRLYFSPEQAHVGVVDEAAASDDLQSDCTLRILLLGFVHDPHSARAELPEDAEIPDSHRAGGRPTHAPRWIIRGSSRPVRFPVVVADRVIAVHLGRSIDGPGDPVGGPRAEPSRCWQAARTGQTGD